MKLTEKTLTILKNYSQINTGIRIEANTKLLETKNKESNIISYAAIDDVFPNKVVLYDLPLFLSILSSCKAPDITFNENHLLVTDGKANIKIGYCAEASIVYATKKINEPAYEVNFNLSKEQLGDILKFAGILGLPHILITNENGKVVLKIVDKATDSTNNYSLEVGEYTQGVDFKFYVKVELLKLIPDSYSVSISKAGLLKLNNSTSTQQYFIGIEQNGSSYGKE